jgi:hypothetical protein
MPNNPGSTGIENTTQFSVRVTYRPELPYMIPEGRLEHLNEIAAQLDRYEQWEPKWDIVKYLMSIFTGLALGGIGILVPFFLQKITISPVLAGIVLLVTMVSIIGALICFHVNCIHHDERREQYGNEARKVRFLIAKIKESVIHEPQGGPPAA